MPDDRLAHSAWVADIDLIVGWMPYLLDLSVVSHDVLAWSAWQDIMGP
jgi:hypothetical protein